MNVIVRYWNGTQQFTGIATTYRGAMRIVARNRNAYPPTFEDEQGRRLYDVEYGLAYEEVDERGDIVCVV
jgi:hypothetical protein